MFVFYYEFINLALFYICFVFEWESHRN